MTPSKSASDILARMPKTELHLHLEGTVGPETLWELAATHGVTLPAPTLEELRKLYEFTSFDMFLTLWLAMHSCFKDAAAYELMVDRYVAECRRQNIRYVEAHFTPFNHEQGGLGGRGALDVVSKRLRAAEAAGGPITRLILDISTVSLPEGGEYTAELLESLADPIVVAIGLGGPEVGFPRKDSASYFRRATQAGYAAVAHAGETFGAVSVREAIEDLNVRRVQHGIRAVEEPTVLALLAQRQICCDVALTSNTLLTEYRSLADHPLKTMLAAGVPVTLGTDDPAFFNTDLVREYTLAHEEVGLPLEELWQLNLNGLRFGLAAVPLRRRLMMEFQEAWRTLSAQR